MNKPHLTVLLGAGASFALGLPSTNQLTDAVWSALKAEEPRANLLAGGALPGELLRVTLDRFYGGTGKTNFEHVIHALEGICSLDSGWRHRSGVVEAALTSGPDEALSSIFNDRAWIFRAMDRVFKTLHNELHNASDEIDERGQAWTDFRNFLRQLNDSFDLHIITLNYDETVERALGWGSAEQGFEPVSGLTASRFFAFRLPPRLIHLHGSLSFGYCHNLTAAQNDYGYDFHELFLFNSAKEARKTWEYLFRGQHGSQSNRYTIVGPLISGLQKTDKLLTGPYDALGRHAANLLAMHPRLLIAGFGFGDFHVNQLINRTTRIHRGDRRVVLVDWTDPKKGWKAMDCTWVKERYALQNSICLLSGEDGPLDALNNHDLDGAKTMDTWTSNDERLRIHLCGLGEVTRRHTSGVVDFLLRP